MDKLDAWMSRNGETDATMAEKVGVSRVSVYRIRTGQHGASKETALAFERVTLIPWHEFIGPAVGADAQ